MCHDRYSTSVSTATGSRRRPIQAPGPGLADCGHWIAVTPDSKTVYVTGFGTLIRVRGDHALAPIAVPRQPDAITLDTQRGAVTPINLVTHTVGKPIASGEGSFTMLFGQGASIGYLIETGRVLALNTATNATLPPIKLPADVIDWGEAVRQ